MSVSMIMLHDFMTLFRGNETTRGVFLPSGTADENGKEQGSAFTERSLLTEEDYLQHLEGKKGLGIVPIREDAKCYFGVIDLDDVATTPLIPPILRRYGYPLIPFRSKSGGLHLYAFFREPTAARKVIDVLNTYRRTLGLPKQTEIFPKQAKLENNAMGNWINLPYYKSASTTRYLIGEDGTALTLEEAINYCAARTLLTDDLEKHLASLPINDGPPCIQAIYLRGHTPMRNNYMFSHAVYLKSKYGDDFEQKVVEANSALEVPLPLKEISDTIVNSLKKKDYAYKCAEEPLCSICDKTECKKREFGVGSSSVPELSFEQLSQYLADPPYYEWMINGKLLRFYSEADIINQQAFRTLCFRILHILPMRLKDETWTRVVNTALTNIKAVSVDSGDDISIGAMFTEYLTEFLTKRASAANKDQILMDRVFKDDELHAYVFRSKNLVNFLVIQKTFRAFGQTEIQARLRDLGGKAIRYYVNKQNSTLRVWTLPFKGLETFVEPDVDQVSIDFMEEFENEQY